MIPELNLTPEKAGAEAERYANDFRSVTTANSFDLHSTRLQMLRYRNFFVQVNPEMEPAAKIADRVLKILPDVS
jgi:hypothetical protein